MSNDGYQHIKKTDEGKYILYYGVASNDHRTQHGEFDTLEEAIKEAQQDYAEYGLSFDIGADTSVTDLELKDD